MSFEKFKTTGTKSNYRISIRARGNLAFSQGIARRYSLENYPYALLYFDKKTKRIAIQPVEREEEGAVKIRKTNHEYQLSTRAFFHYFNILQTETKRYFPEWDNKMKALIIHLERS